MTDTLEPEIEVSTPDPVASQQAREAFPSGGANSQATPATGGEPRESTKVLEDAPKPAAKKSGLDRVGAAKNPEVAKVAAEEPEVAKGVAKPAAKGSVEENLRVLGRAKEEWDKAKPEFEKTKTELASVRKEYEELKSIGLNEKERAEYVRYRDLNAKEAVRQSEEFKNEIMAPIQKNIGKINSASQNATLSEDAHRQMLLACDIPDEWQRNKAIRAAIATADLEMDDVKTLSDIVIASAKELNEVWYPKEDEKMAKAAEIEAAAKERDQNQYKEFQGKQKAEFENEHKSVLNILSTDKLKQLVEDPTLVIEGVSMIDAMKGAAQATTMRDRAFEVHAAAALPFVVEDRNRWRAKYDELEKANHLRNGSAPSRSDGQPKVVVEQGGGLTAREVFSRR